MIMTLVAQLPYPRNLLLYLEFLRAISQFPHLFFSTRTWKKDQITAVLSQILWYRLLTKTLFNQSQESNLEKLTVGRC